MLFCPGSIKAERINENPDVVDNEYFHGFMTYPIIHKSNYSTRN